MGHPLHVCYSTALHLVCVQLLGWQLLVGWLRAALVCLQSAAG